MLRTIAAGTALGVLLAASLQLRRHISPDMDPSGSQWLQTGTLPANGSTVAIYRNVTVADMLQELELIKAILLSRQDEQARLLASSIEALMHELRLSFQEDLAHSFHHLSKSRQETYNDVALLVVDLRVLVRAMMQQERSVGRRASQTA